MTGAENTRITELSERLARVETKIEALTEMRDDVRTIKEAIATSKGWRLGFLTAIPAVAGGGIGAWLQGLFGSGGPTGTH